MSFLKSISYNLSLYQNKIVTVIELRHENEQNIMIYSRWKKFQKIFCEEISNNCKLLISHILPKKKLQNVDAEFT